MLLPAQHIVHTRGVHPYDSLYGIRKHIVHTRGVHPYDSLYGIRKHTVHTRGVHLYDSLYGIRTHRLSGRAAADLLLRPHNHMDRLRSPLLNDKFVIIIIINLLDMRIFRW